MSRVVSEPGPYGATDAELPVHATFSDLRDRWIAHESRRRKGARVTYQDVALRLGARPQQVAQWASGSDGRRAPWWAIVALAHDLGLEARVSTAGIRLARLTRATTRLEGGTGQNE